MQSLCNVTTGAGCQVFWQRRHCMVGMVESEAHKRHRTYCVNNVFNPLPIVNHASNRPHMVLVLLRKLTRQPRLSEFSNRDFAGRSLADFSLAKLVNREPNVAQSVPVTTSRLLQQWDTEHDLAGGQQP